MNLNLDLVIVTYNRLAKLEKTLDLYDRQTTPFRSLIVVDNCSTDGTIDYLKKWKEKAAKYNKYLICLPENRGGSGGFYEGQKFAMSLNPDWVYVSDDDAYPEADMVEQFYSFTQKIDASKVAAICATVYNNDGSIAYEHRSNFQIKNGVKFIRLSSTDADYTNGCFQINLLSYVGSFLNAKALEKVGLCNKDLFIYYDDTEHSIRLAKYGKLLCCSSIKIRHDSGINDISGNVQILISWREYYYTRNKINMLKRHFIIPAIYITLKFICISFKILIKSLIYPLNRYMYKLFFASIYDAWSNKLGKHPIYKPGFCIYQ